MNLFQSQPQCQNKLQNQRLPKKVFTMSKTIFLTVSVSFTTLIAPTAFAKNTASAQQSTAQAQQIFNQLSAQKFLRANFIQSKKIPSLGKTFKSTGQVLYSQPQGVLWQIATPVKADLIMTDKTLIQKTARTQSKITLDKSPYGAVANMFLQLMSGDQKALNKNFNITSIQVGQGSNATWKIALTPKSSTLKKLFKSVNATGTSYVQNMQIVDMSNATTTIQFTPTKNNSNALSSAEHALFKLAQ
ncbi:Outer membrane lipoprotein-sorting protein [Acinetobacter marinus]|uniref:Outer membrane lipoprotein-sorting protein n=2 Tax=Acinetobacter marinus TaxID=281375 RepID=A0A1G6M2Z8_9GAMM|nr:Outer membrane lipoprotein-sorting protein [Acinetobacter marinus]